MKNCNLIATLPVLTNLEKIENIISNDYICGVRWNTGIVSPYSEIKTISLLKSMTEKYNKKFWVDLKGRQLRIIEWAAPMYECIKLNHNIFSELPTVVILRGEEPLNITFIEGNSIYVDPLPRHCVGSGQSINILSDSLEIEGYLTEKDKLYIECCKNMDVNHFMASFVENIYDLAEIASIYPESKIVCKIESPKGISLIPNLQGCNIMAARDDLYIELKRNPKDMYTALEKIIQSDKDAICASRIFSSLETSSVISFSDYQDLEMMYNMGYKNYMLCDNICNYHFDRAIDAWKGFINT